MKRQFTIPQKPFASSEAEKRTGPRPRLGLRYGASLDANGEGGAAG